MHNSISINFLPNQNLLVSRDDRRFLRHVEESEEKVSADDSPQDLAVCSDDSVYDSTYQEIDRQSHPLLRAAKLTKRIRKDKRLT